MSPTRNVPQVLVQLDVCVEQARAEQTGALWRLAEPGRQLDSNLIRLLPGAGVGEHVEGDLDVLLVVVGGGGLLHGGRPDGEPLGPGGVSWLPRGARRSVKAGPDGLVYLTVHQRRPALSVRGLTVPAAERGEGGEGPCRLDRVCTACGRLSPETSARYCAQCGELLPTRES